MTGNLRYVFGEGNAIVDRSNSQRRWSAGEFLTDDYAIVTRIVNSRSGTTILAVAGIGYAGTQAAADFVTNPRSILALTRSLPKGWERKNIQVVLHTSITNRLPDTPDVVATYCW